MHHPSTSWRLSGIRAVLAGAIALASLQASATLVTSRAALGGNETLTWGQLGADDGSGNPIATVPALVTTSTNASASVGSSTGELYRFDEGGGTFAGDFTIGEKLLGTFGTGGNITIDFATGVSRIGAQIQSLDIGAFTAFLDLYDAADVWINTVSVTGTGGLAQDGSALFLGYSQAAVNIDHVVFRLLGDVDLFINDVSISRERGQTNEAPEPTSLALVLLAGALATRRRSKR